MIHDFPSAAGDADPDPESEALTATRHGEELALLRDIALSCHRALDLPGAMLQSANFLLAYLRQPARAVLTWKNPQGERQGMLADGNDEPVALSDESSAYDVALKHGMSQRIVIPVSRPGEDEQFAALTLLFGARTAASDSIHHARTFVAAMLSEVAGEWWMPREGEDQGRQPVGTRSRSLIRKLADQVEHQTQRSDLVLESIAEAVFETDAEGRVLFASRSCERMFGVPSEKLEGSLLLPTLAAGERALASALWRSLIRGGNTGRAMKLQLPLRRASGGNLHAELNARKIARSRDDKITYVCTIHDLSEQKAFADELEKSNRKLDESLRLKDEFLACMSHELRTPLNSILGFADLLSEGTQGGLTDPQLKSLRFIAEAGRHLLELINDLLDVSKIGAGEARPHPEPTRLDQLLLSATRMIAEAARKKSLIVQVDNRLPDTAVNVDSRRLRQVLVNLLSNAVKFTEPGGEITLVASVEPDGHRFEIRDTGIGIKPKHQDEIFQPFHQLDAGLRRGQGGTGLGLYLVKQICELMNGSITVRSQLGKGSSFIVRLPLETSPPAEMESPAPIPDPFENTPASIPARTVLLVEDDTRNLQLLLTYLKAKGFPVTIAKNGQEACEKALQLHPALILMDGIEATSRITSNPETRHIPIVAVTAQAMVGDRERCLAAGARDYLTKPVNLRKLGQLISRTLDSGR